jgi:glyoxylase-like metal-dependent hydrolase (beta-lactamase superfamily II)
MKSITAKELHDRMQTAEGTFVLDVRASGAYQEWRIQDKGLVSVNIQNSKLKEFGPESFEELPKDREIVAVCAKGVSAKETASMLSESGYSVSVLEGGMGAWSEFYYPVAVEVSDDFELYQMIRPAKGCLSYFLVSNGEAVIVDPNRHANVYLDFAKEKGVKITNVLDTHLHADHITGAHDLVEATGAKYWISASEMQGAKWGYNALTNGLKIEFGSSVLEVMAIATPGHTPGSTSFLVNKSYFLSGDTVFVNGLGRPDLGGKAEEWAKMLYQTIITELNALSDEVIILPSHYSDFREITAGGYVGVVLGDLRKKNNLVLGGDEAIFTESVAKNTGATPPNYETIIDINRGVLSVSDEEKTNLEIGPNRCAVKHYG